MYISYGVVKISGVSLVDGDFTIYQLADAAHAVQNIDENASNRKPIQPRVPRLVWRLVEYLF